MELATTAYWVFHMMGGLFAFVMSAISGRATVTVLLVLILEFLGLIAGILPGGANIGFALEFFGGIGLIAGVPLSLGRGRLAWWFLPVLAVGTFVALRIPLFWGAQGSWIVGALLGTGISALSLGLGLLAGHGLTGLTPFGRRGPKPPPSI
ncbi:MAG TPA: hypothetical protein VKZ18_01815 [Polyangia bacterium]|nr:hypothetical protein [Polyangia bacterium]